MKGDILMRGCSIGGQYRDRGIDDLLVIPYRVSSHERNDTHCLTCPRGDRLPDRTEAPPSVHRFEDAPVEDDARRESTWVVPVRCVGARQTAVCFIAPSGAPRRSVGRSYDVIMSLAAWVCSLVTVASAGVSLGYAVAGLRAAAGAARTPSSYALTRSVALTLVAVVAPMTGSVGFIAAAAVAMILVQALDSVVGAQVHDRVKTVGPAITAIVNAVALIWLL